MALSCFAKKNIFRLSYVSRLVCSNESAADSMLAVILAQSLKNNPQNDISGILYYDRRTFSVVQILEGPEPAVRDLSKMIMNDRRHKDVRIIESRFASKRLYADFGMALARTTVNLAEAGAAAKHALSPQYARRANREKMHLVRLQYTSTLMAKSVNHARKVLQDILQASMSRNFEMSIGGLLCFNPETMGIVQILEGPAYAVKSTYLRIEADTRHTKVQRTSEELLSSKEEAHFNASWGMLQSETVWAQMDMLDLAARIGRAYTGEGKLSADRQKLNHAVAQALVKTTTDKTTAVGPVTV